MENEKVWQRTTTLPPTLLVLYAVSKNKMNKQKQKHKKKLGVYNNEKITNIWPDGNHMVTLSHAA